MTSLQTFFRAVVMLATLGIVAKAWHLYGPSVDEVHMIVQRVVQVTDELLSEYRQGTGAPSAVVDDPRVQPRELAADPPTQQAQPIQLATAETQGNEFAQQTVALSSAESTPTRPAAQLTRAVPESTAAVPESTAAVPESTAAVPESTAATAELTPVNPLTNPSARLEAARARLAQLGVRDQQLGPWGADGRLVRFCCTASWVDAPNYSRHFEAVAADPATAVEQVAAEVEAWRAAQNAASRGR